MSTGVPRKLLRQQHQKTLLQTNRSAARWFLENHPHDGAHFFNCFYFGGVEYAANYRFETGNRLDSYEDKLSIALNRILRHNVGESLRITKLGL